MVIPLVLTPISLGFSSLSLSDSLSPSLSLSLPTSPFLHLSVWAPWHMCVSYLPSLHRFLCLLFPSRLPPPLPPGLRVYVFGWLSLSPTPGPRDPHRC